MVSCSGIREKAVAPIFTGQKKGEIMTRRQFLAGSGSAMLWGTGRAWCGGANDRVRLAVVGIHGMGQSHIDAYLKLPNVEVAALCDVDENQFGPVIKKHFAGRGLKTPKTYTDLRKLYEDKEIDGVSVVTPNHWHTLAAIWAIQAGKHVSVEKPCCHNVFEGQKLVEAAKKYRVLVQDGAEQRSNPARRPWRSSCTGAGWARSTWPRASATSGRNTIGRYPDEAVPAGVDYDLWLGPAPKRPFNKNRFHYNWHWNWEYGNGDMGNQGVHEMDIARWGLGVTLPTKITAMGGHFMFDDDQQTPNVLMAMYEFPNPEAAATRRRSCSSRCATGSPTARTACGSEARRRATPTRPPAAAT
jgi:predicted dehydrogenase